MSIKKRVSFVRDDGEESRKYDDVENFHNGFAAVYINGKGWGFIDEEFNEICELKYDQVDMFRNGLACVKLNRHYGFINSKGEEICPIKYYDVWGFSSYGVAMVQLDDKYGFINMAGEEVCAPKYDYISQYSEPIRTNPIGNIMFAPIWESALQDYNGWWNDELAIIFLGEKKGLINSRGKVVLEPCYDDVKFPNDQNEKYIPVCLNEKWGYIDKTGKEVTSIIYDWYTNYTSLTEKTCLSVDGLYGYINESGEEICPFKYDEINPFVNGYAAVRVKDKWGYINEQFEEICPIEYHLACRFEPNGYAEVYTKGIGLLGINHGYINGKGEFFKKLPD